MIGRRPVPARLLQSMRKMTPGTMGGQSRVATPCDCRQPLAPLTGGGPQLVPITIIGSEHSAQTVPDGEFFVWPVPAGTQDGDLLVYCYSSTLPLSMLASGFIEAVESAAWASRYTEIEFKLVVGTPPASYSRVSGGGRAAGGLITLRGVDPNDPVDTTRQNTGLGSAAVTLTSMTTTRADCLLIATAGGEGPSQTWTVPGDMVEEWDHTTTGSSSVSNATAHKQLGVAEATGDQTFTPSFTTRWGGCMAAFIPAQPG